MFAPVSGIIRVSDEVANYQSHTPKRICLQKTGEGEWEVQFVNPTEEEAPSWYRQQHPTIFDRIRNIFSRSTPPFNEHTDRIILDASFSRDEKLNAIETQDAVRLSHTSEGMFSASMSPVETAGINTVKEVILSNLRNHIPNDLLSEAGTTALANGAQQAQESANRERAAEVRGSSPNVI